MNNEEKKRRFTNIVYRLRSINRKIDDLNNEILRMEDLTKKSIVVDNNFFNYEKINSLKNELKGVSGSIRESTIPSINNKINHLV